MQLHVTENFVTVSNFTINFIQFFLQFGSYQINFMNIHLSCVILRKISENLVQFSQF